MSGGVEHAKCISFLPLHERMHPGHISYTLSPKSDSHYLPWISVSRLAIKSSPQHYLVPYSSSISKGTPLEQLLWTWYLPDLNSVQSTGQLTLPLGHLCSRDRIVQVILIDISNHN
jgi:hypothetical protein